MIGERGVPMDDQEILDLLFSRSEYALAALERKYGTYCMTIAYRILHSAGDCEECLNDTWLKVWNAVPPQRPDDLRVYLARIVRNTALDRYRAQTAEKRRGLEITVALHELEECLPGEDAERHVLSGELKDEINRFLRALPERDCNVFLRRYFYVESYGEISRRYGISEVYVRQILCRVRRKLKKHLEKEGYFV